MNKNFYYVESVQTWVNLKHVESVYRTSDKWNMQMQSGKEITLTDNEYWKLADVLREPKPQMPMNHPFVPQHTEMPKQD